MMSERSSDITQSKQPEIIGATMGRLLAAFRMLCPILDEDISVTNQQLFPLAPNP